jgi:hypothetical protein
MVISTFSAGWQPASKATIPASKSKPATAFMTLC